MTVFGSWMNQPFKWFGSIAMTHLLTVTCCHLLVVLISHLQYFFIKYQYPTFYESKHYLFICNCRLKHSMSRRAALNSVQIYLLHFRRSFCVSSTVCVYVCIYIYILINKLKWIKINILKLFIIKCRHFSWRKVHFAQYFFNSVRF